MESLKIIAGNFELDCNREDSVAITYQISDILDITSRNSNFTKTIILKGTPTNNKFFKQIFDVNIDSSTFNPVANVNCKLEVDGETLINGNLQLININVNSGYVEYEVIICGYLNNVISQFGDLSIKNIDLSEFNHNRNKTNIINSWDYNVIINTNPFPNGGPGLGYVYPYIINGNDQDIYNKMYVYNLYPAPYVKTVVDKMFENINVTYTSEFFNSEYFKMLILPFVNDKLEMSDVEYNERTFRIGVDGTRNETSAPLIGSYPGTFTPTGYRNLSLQKSSTSGWFKNEVLGYWVPLEKVTGTTNDIQFQDTLNQWDKADIPPSAYAAFVCARSGFYDISLDGSVIMKYVNTNNSANLEWNTGEINYFYRLVKFNNVNNTTQIIYQSAMPATFAPSAGSFATPWYDVNNPLSITMNANNIYLNVNDEVRIEFAIESPTGGGLIDGNWVGIPDSWVTIQALLGSTDVNGVSTVFEIIPSNKILQGDNDYMDMNQILPDIKQKDLFMSLVKAFDLIVMENPNKINDLIIEPSTDFYKSKPKKKDWTYKLDRSSDIIYIPMSELDSKKYDYSYGTDDDYFNAQYTYETKRTYGDFSIEVQNDFSNETKKTELLFAATPNSQWSIGGRVAPFFANIENNILSTRKVKPRILFYGGRVTTNDAYKLKYNDSDSGTTLNDYAYCGMWDHPTNPQYDLAFGNTDKIYWSSNVFPTNNLIQQFHKNTLENITDINSRLMIGYFNLTIKDISEFDFRDIIFIDGNYWRINKIIDFNPAEPNLTKVELFRLNNYNFNIKSQSDIQIGAQCPTDMVVRLGKDGNRYESQSGQIITTECCKSIGGSMRNGLCYTNRFWSTDGVSNDAVAKRLVTLGDINATPISVDRTTKMNDSNNTVNSAGVVVYGTNNYVDKAVTNTVVQGDNNVVLENTSNVNVIGNDNTVTNDLTNVFVFGDANTIGLDPASTGTTPSSISNVFAVGTGMTINNSNTIYTQNIVMPADGTFNGNPIVNVTGYDYVTEVTTAGSESFKIDVPDGTNSAIELFENGSIITTTTNGSNETVLITKTPTQNKSEVIDLSTFSVSTIDQTVDSINSTINSGSDSTSIQMGVGFIRTIVDDGTDTSIITQSPTNVDIDTKTLKIGDVTTNTTVGNYSTAIGETQYANGIHSLAYGKNNTTIGNYALAFGENCTAFGDYSLAEGKDNEASGRYSHAGGQGVYTIIDGETARNGTPFSGVKYGTANGYTTTTGNSSGTIRFYQNGSISNFEPSSGSYDGVLGVRYIITGISDDLVDIIVYTGEIGYVINSGVISVTNQTTPFSLGNTSATITIPSVAAVSFSVSVNPTLPTTVTKWSVRIDYNFIEL